jgi:DNA polymerase-3 subunit delta'
VFFRDVIGQEKIKRQLIVEVNENRMAHGLLLYGREGTGALPLAMAYARYVNCTNRGADDACGVCPSCIKMNKLVHPDVHYTYPMVKKDGEVCAELIRDWREIVIKDGGYFGYSHWLKQIEAGNSQGIIYTKEGDEITKFASMKSVEAPYKVAIIWMPERLHPTVANKLLKLFEEPPQGTIFILVSEAPDKILPTVLSRMQRIAVPVIDEADIADALTHKFNILEAQSKNIAHLANGNFIKALEEIHIDEENRLYFDFFVNLMRIAYAKNIREMRAWSERVAGMGRERQKSMLGYCQRMVRENFVYNFHRREMVYMSADEQGFAVKFAPFINEKNVMGLMDELSEAQRHIEQNANPKIVFFDLTLKVTVLIKQR